MLDLSWYSSIRGGPITKASSTAKAKIFLPILTAESGFTHFHQNGTVDTSNTPAIREPITDDATVERSIQSVTEPEPATYQSARELSRLTPTGLCCFPGDLFPAFRSQAIRPSLGADLTPFDFRHLCLACGDIHNALCWLIRVRHVTSSRFGGYARVYMLS